MNLGLFVLRLVVGLLFIGHGSQKLFGWFGGAGLEGTAGLFESIGLRPGATHARLASGFECGGGILLVLGLLTPLAAMLLTAVMVAAIITVHYAKGLWNSNGGFEFNLVLIAALFALAGAGAGDWSLDHALPLHDANATWAITAAVLGVIGAVGAVSSGRRTPARSDRRRPRRGPTATSAT
jgi:putative oxidoreductase